MGVRFQVFLFALLLIVLFVATSLSYSLFLSPRFEKQREAELFGQVVASSGNLEAEANRLLYNDILVQGPKFSAAVARYRASRTDMGTVEALTHDDPVFSESIIAIGRVLDQNLKFLQESELRLADLVQSLSGPAPLNGWTVEALVLYGSSDDIVVKKARRVLSDLHVLGENLTTARRALEERSSMIALEITRIETRNGLLIGVVIALALLASVLLSFRTAASIVATNERSKVKLRQVNDELNASLEKLKLAQEKLLHSEKLAVLGKLSASVAHELNTPLGAIVSATGSVKRFMSEDFPRTFTFLDGLDGLTRSRYFSLLAACDLSLDRVDRGPTRAEVKAIGERLDLLGVPQDPVLTELVAEKWFAPLLDTMPDLFLDSRCAQLLEVAREHLTALQMLEVVALAANKAATVTNALRKYLTSGAETLIDEVDVEKALELVLSLLQSLLKQGIVVERDYCGAKAVGSADRLEHVWTNLITNAVQAMDFRGTLRLSTRVVSGTLEVTVGDTGKGIPKEIANRVFEPFFSTKQAHEGLGLGLDICSAILESLGGSIRFESCPGDTRFTVSLPLAAPA